MRSTLTLRIAIIATVFISNLTSLHAQSPIGEGGKQVNGGFGLSSWGIPIFAGFDYGVHDDVTVGGEVSYRRYRERWLGRDFDHSIMGFLVNGNYHFNTLLEIPSDFDLYAGLNLGFYVWSSPEAYGGDGGSGLGLGLQLGGRYYFTEKIGVLFELTGGNSVANAKVGISGRF